MEETEGRKTRSTRAKKTPVKKPPTPRATRGRRAKAAVDDEVENDQIEGQDEIVEAEVSEHENASEENHEEQILEDSDQPNPQEVMAQLQEIVVPVEESDMGQGHESKDESSSNFAFEEFPTDTLTYEQSSNEKEENPKEEVFIADLAEENANSLPSGCDENSRNDSGEKASENREFNIQEKQAESGAMEVDGEDKPQTESGSSNDKIKLAREKSEAEAKSDEHNETGESDFAIAETIENGTNEATDLDAEMVSEDELPAPHKPKVQDAEEVSDDELPGPKMAELPADTEVVSEEEMPNKDDETGSKKDAIKRKIDDYDPSSPTEDSEAPEKKAKTDSDTEKADKPKPKLPDLDKYWKAVNEDTTDFTAWTYLLQYVDQENDVDAAREAYDAFLAHYPYCYGYWRKYADYEKRKANKDKCEEVFERGLKAIPLSVDLWIHYLTHVKQTAGENLEFVRNEFERALTACGLEFRSDKLWEAYIKWENEGKNIRNVVSIYDRLLATPTQGYNNHFDNFKDVVNNNPPHLLVTTKEFLKLREEIRRDFSDGKEVETDDQVPPGEDEPDDHVRNEEEAQAIKDRICSKRKKIHKATVTEVTNRWTYEEGIKRPYFHVKPLERCQLKNWKEYLDFEIEQGDQKRIIVLFERCLIACALYDEFWLKLLRYLESRKEDPDYEAKARDAYERACNIHHKDKPSLHLMWSAFEETHNNSDRAAEILQNLEKTCPNLLQVAYRRINLERRRGDFEKCVELYEHYISTAKNKSIAGSLSIKYARFLHKIKQDLEGSLKLLKQSLEKDPSNTRIALQYIDLALQREHVDEAEIVEIMDNFMAREGIDPDQKVLFAQRKVEFLEDFGTNVKGLQEAQRALQQTLNKANEHKKKSSSGRESPSKKSKEASSASGNGVPSSYNYSGYGQSGQGQYYGTGSSQYSYGNTGYDYNQWSGYQQSAGYTNYGQYGYGSYY